MTGPTDRTTRLLLLVAHPDDETFGCGSLLAYAAARAVTTVVGCATRGEAGIPPPGLEPGDLPAVREAELRAAAALLGVTRVDVFSWVDSGMDGEPEAGTLMSAPLDDV